MRTKLKEDEHLVNICDSESGIDTYLHVRIGKDNKIYHYDQRTRSMTCSTKGKIFITNKRIIFESSKEEESSQNHFFYHKDIEITNGRNGRYLPPIPGAFLIYPFEEIDWADEFRSTPVYERVIRHDTQSVSLIVNNEIGYEYFPFSYGADLSNKLNNEFYSPHKERVNHYLKENDKLYLLDKEETRIKNEIDKAKHHEKLMEFDRAVKIYKKLGKDEEVIRVREEQRNKVNIDQNVVHGDQITKTEIKDSVLNRSNVGAGGKSKAEEIKEIKELLDSGAIDGDEFKQMKKEVLGNE